jgi:hypothetical protein
MNVQHGSGWALVCKAFEKASNSSSFAETIRTDLNEIPRFCDNPAQYAWTLIDKREMLVPYDCTPLPSLSPGDSTPLKFPNAINTRWEMHRVFVVEGILLKGESNRLERRRFYVEEDSWLILLGEGYDNGGAMAKCFMLYKSEAHGNNIRGRWYPLCNSETQHEI